MKKIQYLLKQMMPLIVIIVFTIGLLVYFYKGVITLEKDACWQTLEGTASTISDVIKVQMNDNINTLRLASSAMVQEERVESHEAIVQHINAFQNMTIFSRIDVLYPDGTALIQNGKTLDASEHESFEYITSHMENGVYLSSRVDDIVTGEQIVQCYVAVLKDDEPAAFLVGIIKCADLTGYFGSRAYGGKVVSCIVNSKDGNFIMDDWHDTLGNVYEMKDRKTLPEYKDVNLKTEIKENNTGVTAYISEKNGNASYMYFMPTGIKSWELLLVAQEDVVFSGAEIVKRYFTMFSIVEAILLLLYFLWGGNSTYQLLRNKETLEKQLRISNTLNSCTKELAFYSNADVAINGFLRIINEFFVGDRTYIFNIDYNQAIGQNTYEFVAGNGISQIQKWKSVPIEAVQSWIETFKTKNVFFISDVDKDADGKTIIYEFLVQQNIHSLLAFPLLKKGSVVGFLGVDNPKANTLSPELLESIQYFIMDALDKKEKQKVLEKMSIIDGMTDIFNRNKFMLYVAECEKNEYQQIGVAYFDLNDLKQTNDELGHEAGDKLIIAVAEAISSVFPKQTFRIGGDEFAVVVPDVTEEDFSRMVTELCESITKEGHSISCGIAYCSEGGKLGGTMKEADCKMYEDKRNYYEIHDRRR
ncbi:MAG: sensor domain-containing diguanylate cyclase [Anaerostipes sp.]|nr:sensor domain-containing diguanylate cyclase [Anaerostipes sp.]